MISNQVVAVILGGGAGSRLYPLTSTRSKPAVPIAGKYRLVDNAQVNQTGEAVSRFVEDGDFLRIQNIILGYSLPNSILDKISASSIKSIKVFGQIQNAITFTKYTGLDPELGVGFDNNTNPLNRTYTMGINIGF
jgi:hypothetical protein